MNILHQVLSNPIGTASCERRYMMHLKLVDWSLLVAAAKPIYGTGPMYKFCVYFCSYINEFNIIMLVKLDKLFISAMFSRKKGFNEWETIK